MLRIIQKRKHLILPAGAVLIASAAFFYYIGDRGSIYWRKSPGQMYSISCSTSIYAKNPNAAPIYNRMELKGILNFRILEIRKETVRAAFQLSQLKIVGEGRRIEAAEKLYSELFFADIKKNGEFIKFHFNSSISSEDEKNIKDIITSFQFIIKKSLFAKWNTEESDRNGRYKAVYKFTDRGKINKSKIEYINARNNMGKTVIKKSGLTVSFGKPWTWVKTAAGNELTVFYSKNRVLMKVSSSVNLKIIEFNPGISLAIWNNSLDPNRKIHEWKTKPKNRASIADLIEKKSLKEKFGDRGFNKIADEVFRKYGSFNSECIKTLMEFLKLHPKAAQMFPGYLLGKKLNPAQRVMLTHVLGRTGTEEAQLALTVIMNGREFPVESRKQAAIAFGSIKKPVENAVQSLWEAYENRNSDPENSDSIANSALLSLGAMAKNLGNYNDRAYAAVAENIKKRIAGNLETEQDINTTAALLHAAGNTADESFIEPISSYLNNENPGIRTAAVTSLAYMDDERVNGILTEVLDNEDNVNVRNAVVATMYRKAPSPEAIDKILEMLPQEDNDIVRGRMYKYLLKNREFPGVRDSLKEMLTNERVTENRKIIYNALYTNKKSPNKSNLN